MKIGFMNVRTLGGQFVKSDGGVRETRNDLRKLPLFLHEFGRLDLQVIAVAESRTTEKEYSMEGYKCFFSGKEDHQSGVGILVCDKWAERVARIERINECIMWVAGKFDGVDMAVIVAYAPCLDKGMR